MRDLTVSIYFMWEWWEQYFHKNIPRPGVVDEDALDTIYLKRKRFLFEEFGGFGIGEEIPVMDGAYVNMVLKYGMDLIPYLFGAELTCQNVGGWMSGPFSKETLAKLEPVDIAEHPFAEYLLKEKEKKLKRYGSVNVFLDYESPTNIAARLRGEEFYLDLIDDEGFVRHLLQLSTESICNIFKFGVTYFPPASYHGVYDISLGNCNVTLLSPEMYVEIIKPFDLKFAVCSEKLSGMSDRLLLHHCDVEVDKFIEAYRDIPNLKAIQASHRSDIARVMDRIPGVSFCAMLNPGEMRNMAPNELESAIERMIKLGSVELDLWNIDPSIAPEQLRSIFGMISKYSRKYNVEAQFKVIPFCWDELEWAFPRYQSRHCIL